MDSFWIQGGKKLEGEIRLQGSKNASLPILAASIIPCEGTSVIANVPEIDDVVGFMRAASSVGIRFHREKGCVCVGRPSRIGGEVTNDPRYDLRGSVLLLGALCAARGGCSVEYPGGCAIGARPVDIHLSAFRALGAEIVEENDRIRCNARKMRAGKVALPYPSVGATENLLLVASTLPGETRIVNAAREPEIVDLCHFLRKIGVSVRGDGEREIVVCGNRRLHGAEHFVCGDRIVLGTHLIATACCGGKVVLSGAKNVPIPTELSNLLKSCCILVRNDDMIYIESIGKLRTGVRIRTAPYPGFPTDLQAPLAVLLSLSEGRSKIRERVFENRFGYASELRNMGADITVRDSVATVVGVPGLHGAEVFAGDLRGGASLFLAGLAAEGETYVRNARHIDRGYESPENTYEELGATVRRV